MAILLNIEPYDNGIKLDSFVKRHFKGLTKSNFYKLLRTGQIRVNGKRVKSGCLLNINDTIRFPPFISEYSDIVDNNSLYHDKVPSASKSFLKEIKNNILYEDDSIIAINKPSGLAVQGGSKVFISIDKLINTFNDGCIRLVHRLDKETSGVMILAKTLNAARRLTHSFKEKLVRKTYVALCYGIFDKKEGTINKDISDNGKIVTAVTNYKVLAEYKDLISFVELKPITGRKHQLRIHLSNIGHAIVGDRKHCTLKHFKNLNSSLMTEIGEKIESRLYLHAFKIRLPNSIYDIKAPLSEQFLMKLFKKNEIKRYI